MVKKIRGKYNKQNNNGKITLKYFLSISPKKNIFYNADLNADLFQNGEFLHPIYIKITVKRQSTTVRSYALGDFLVTPENYEDKPIKFIVQSYRDDRYKSPASILRSQFSE